MVATNPYSDLLVVPRAARWPIELRVPAGFVAEDLATWPSVEGSLEYAGGKLLYMSPSGRSQALVVANTVGMLV